MHFNRRDSYKVNKYFFNNGNSMTKNLTILMAEDDKGHAHLIQKNFIKFGINNKILHFNDGQEILDFIGINSDSNMNNLNSNESYLLLLDLRMPKIDGFEVLRKIKNDSNLKEIPVIVLTTNEEPNDISECYKLGCVKYITKSVHYDKFITSINNLCTFIKSLNIPKIMI